jgi:hypothetical protein
MGVGCKGTRNVIDPNRTRLEQEVRILQHDCLIEAHCGTTATATSAMYEGQSNENLKCLLFY